jgi:hypothetical protein
VSLTEAFQAEILVGLFLSKPEHSKGQAGFESDQKIWFFRAEKILPMTIPWDASGLSFRAEPGLGWAACIFLVKIAKNSISDRLGPKKFRGLQDI